MWDSSPLFNIVAIAAFGLLVAASVMMARGMSGPSATILTIAGVTSMYVWICPPFQAPDEPDHFLTLSAGVAQEDEVERRLDDSALELANRGWFEAIKFRPEVTFAAEAIGNPMVGGWAQHVAKTGSPGTRSPLAGLLWPRLRMIVSGLSAANGLLVLRGFNALLFIAASVVFLWGGGFGLGSPLVLTLLLTPTLPFFAMHWSNHGLALAAMAAGVGFFLNSVSGRKMQPWHFALWGAVSGAAAVSGATGIATSASLTTLALWAVLLGGIGGVRSPGCSLLFYFIACLSIVFVFADRQYFAMVQDRVREILPLAIRHEEGHPLAMGIIVMATVIAVGLVVVFCEVLARRMAHAKLGETGNFQLGTMLIARIQLALWIAFLLFSIRAPLQILPTIEGNEKEGVTVLRYCFKAAQAFLYGFGTGAGDPLIVESFWGGFGWLDASPPGWLVRMCRAVPTVGITWVLFAAATSSAAAARRLWLSLNVFTLTAILASMAMAGSAYRINVNLHGRYLVPVYFLFLVPAGVGFIRFINWVTARIAGQGEARAQQTLLGLNAPRQLLFLGVLFVHTVCWQSLIVRYLGSS
jgi:hypothetical protein